MSNQFVEQIKEWFMEDTIQILAWLRKGASLKVSPHMIPRFALHRGWTITPR